MHKIKKVIIICLMALIIFIPTAYAADNQTELSLNNDDAMLFDSYYFDANIDDDLGNGSIDSPYKELTYDRVKDNSIIYLNDGTYYGFNKEFNNLTIFGKSSEKTIIRNIQFKVKGSLTIQNVTLINSKINNAANVTLVNSIFKDSSSSVRVLTSNPNTFVNITNCTFLNNHAGVIYANNSSLSIFNSSFEGNYAGVIYADNSSLSIFNSSFEGNYAGVIYAGNSSLSICNSSFEGNYAGVIYAGNSSLSICNSSFERNHANYYAGAIYCGENSSLTLTNTNFTNNHAKKDAKKGYWRSDI